MMKKNDDDDDDDENNNNNNNMQCHRRKIRSLTLLLRSTKMSRERKINI